MTHTQQIDQGFALVRALRSLSFRDAELIEQAVDDAGGGWSVNIADDYDGYLYVLIEPTGSQFDQRPSYLVSGQSERPELALVQGDNYQLLGIFPEILSLTTELGGCLRDPAVKTIC